VEEVIWHIFNKGIKHHTIASGRNKRGISLEFSQHMIVGMVTVEEDHYAFIVSRNGLHTFDDFWCDTGAFDHLNP